MFPGIIKRSSARCVGGSIPATYRQMCKSVDLNACPTWGSRRGEIGDGHKAGAPWKAMKVKWGEITSTHRDGWMDGCFQALHSSTLSFSHFHLQFRVCVAVYVKSGFLGNLRFGASSKKNSQETNLSPSCMER